MVESKRNWVEEEKVTEAKELTESWPERISSPEGSSPRLKVSMWPR